MILLSPLVLRLRGYRGSRAISVALILFCSCLDCKIIRPYMTWLSFTYLPWPLVIMVAEWSSGNEDNKLCKILALPIIERCLPNSELLRDALSEWCWAQVYSFNHYAAEIKPVTRVRITKCSGHFGRGRDNITHSKNISAGEAIYQILVSRSKSVLPSKPMQALRKLSRALRCLLRLLTTSVPIGIFELILGLD